MLDHVSVQCTDPAASAAFYDAVLGTVGGGRVMDFGDVVGYGIGGQPDFWIGPHNTGEGFRESHLAFSAPSRAAVRDFFAAAVGNNVEAVCHLPGE
jgi:catechol 2,3-dioxygenase-like lactoylglutathione lyase family enzyme